MSLCLRSLNELSGDTSCESSVKKCSSFVVDRDGEVGFPSADWMDTKQSPSLLYSVVDIIEPISMRLTAWFPPVLRLTLTELEKDMLRKRNWVVETIVF